MGDSCIPAGDTLSRGCVRLLDVSVASGTPAVVEDVDTGLAGIDMY